MPTIRDALDCLTREALVELVDSRGLPRARSKAELAERLARSYRGRAVDFIEGLRRQELMEILTTYGVTGISSSNRDALAAMLVTLIEGDGRGANGTRPAKSASEWFPTELDSLLPSWIAPLDAPTSSRDPLGLQAIATRNADSVLPGINVFTFRARYYSFLCWAIRESQRHATTQLHLERAHRLERLLVLVESVLHREEGNVCSYIGRRRGGAYLREQAGVTAFPLPSRILKNQTSNGALRLYRTSLVECALAREVDSGEGLDLELTDLGERLAARYEDCVDPTLVRWALDATDTRKREQSISECSAMCLTAAPGAYERRYLVQALFGESARSASDSAGVRRETARILFELGLLTPVDPHADLSEVEDQLVVEAPIRSATVAERNGNWAVISAVLRTPGKPALQRLQEVAIFEAFALALNGLMAAVLSSVEEEGRIGIARWIESIERIADSNFAATTCNAWVGSANDVPLACERMLSQDAWPHEALGALRTLILLLRSDPYVAWLEPNLLTDAGLRSIVEYRNELDTRTPRSFLELLVPLLVERHLAQSARKGKAEWLRIEASELVRAEIQLMRPTTHALRFPQLTRIAADLALQPAEVADAS